MNRQTITVDIAPGAGPVQRLKVSQGDIGRPLGVYIIQNGEALPCSGYSVDLYVLKPDGNYYVASATVATTPTNLVTWETATQETPVAGECKAQIRIRQGDDDVGTANFVEYVEPTPGYLGSASESQIALIEELVEEAQDSADRAEEATTKNPRISSTTDNWEVWNATTEEWVDTGVPATGPQGPEGERGPTGYGVPAGGTTGQVMRKASGTDYDFTWETLNGTDIPMSSTDATSVNAAIAKNEEAMAIVATGNTHAAIAAGGYVYVKGHNSLTEGLYTNTSGSTIAQDATLSSSNLTAVSSGGLNVLNDNYAMLVSDNQRIIEITETVQTTKTLSPNPDRYVLLMLLLFDTDGSTVVGSATITPYIAATSTLKVYGASSSQWGSFKLSADHTQGTFNRTSSSTSKLQLYGIVKKPA